MDLKPSQIERLKAAQAHSSLGRIGKRIPTSARGRSLEEIMPETTPIKPGIKTSEFWIALIVAVSGVGIASGFLTPEQKEALDANSATIAKAIEVAAGAFMAGLAAFGFANSRGLAKSGK